MSKKLSITVMAHPSRERNIIYLSQRLPAFGLVFDRGDGIWDTCKRAWESRPGDAAFHLVLQDDALVCDRFEERATAALTRDMAHSFYFGWRRNYEQNAQMWKAMGEAVLPTLHWGLAVCLPERLIDPMLAHGDASDLPDTHDDTRIKDFLRYRGERVRYPFPSLIDHRPEVSLVTGEYNPVRRALRFIDKRDDEDEIRDAWKVGK